MIVQLRHEQRGRPLRSGPNSEETLDVQKHLDAPGMLFTQHLHIKDTVASEIMTN